MTGSPRLRFRPPPVEPTEELTWILRAAFSATFPEPLAADKTDGLPDLAHRLGLASVIGARLRAIPDPPLLPASLAEVFRQTQARSAILTARHERSAGFIAATAARLSIPLVFLKGFALFLSGRDRAGGRAIGDLDLLVPEAGAATLHAELQDEGYRALEGPGNEHHLAPLVSPEGSNIDLHFCLRGLAFEGSAWATWEDLKERKALLPAKGYPRGCAVPDLGVQTAHLLVHGLSHHVWRPHTYPLLQLVGDLQELLPDEESWQEFLGAFRRIVLRSVHESDLEALRRLTLALHAGRVPDLTAPRQENEAVLLMHILGGYLDETYGRRLRLRHVLGRLGDAFRQRRLGHYLARKAGRQRVD